MKKSIKRFLLTFVVMLCSMSAMAECYSGSCGTNVTWSLDTETGLLTIAGRGKMNDYYYDSQKAPWYSLISTITSAKIYGDITHIGYRAFLGCSNIASLTWGCSECSPYEVTQYCYENLNEVTLMDGMTSIGDDAFHGCAGLSSIIIPQSVNSIGGMAFYGCTGLTSITIPEGVTYIGPDAFTGCSGLDLITVEAGNPSYDCRENCNAIIKTSTNTLITGCRTTIIPNSVTSIGEDAFYDCIGLTSITIPEGVTSIGVFAFCGCIYEA